MTPAELNELLAHNPRLFHMTALGAWASVRRHGLLSTRALLDRAGVGAAQRRRIEFDNRGATIPLDMGDGDTAYIRDQLSMNDDSLRRALPPHITPADWRRRLNGYVFFWLSETRLLRLSNARSYRDAEHEVIVLKARPFVDAYFDSIWLCPINSGNAVRKAAPRGADTFCRIADYDYRYWKKRRAIGDRVAELCVDHEVPDVAPFVETRFNLRGEGKLPASPDER